MALAEKLLAREVNREGHAIVDHSTYVFMGDGCMMEGISHEAAALAGAWKLNKLVALYDDNGISIDGQVAPWFCDNTALRFVAYGWNVLGPIDGHDAALVAKALVDARSSAERPTLIICKTRIGQGSPNRANTAKAHGEPLGSEEIRLTREALGWDAAPFVIGKDIYAAWDAKAAGADAEKAWNARLAAYMNGIALHGGFIPYGGTFLTFSDYSRNAIRMAALMKLRVVHVFTHDSIGLGEDGPTHQSVEHAASLRLIPNLDVWRPADTAETAVAWAVALRNATRPTALLLSRQNISYAPKGHSEAAPDAAGLDAINKGAYVLAEPSEVGLRKRAQAVIIATGSEVQLALKAQELLAQRKIAVRVVSMPSTTTFDRQPADYKAAVLPAGLPRIAVEMGVSDGWWKYGCAAVVGIDTYGESAPAPALFRHFGFTPENVADTVQKVLGKR
jgi:transketolase